MFKVATKTNKTFAGFAKPWPLYFLTYTPINLGEGATVRARVPSPNWKLWFHGLFRASR